MNSLSVKETVIKPGSARLFLDIKELFEYRDLIWALVTRKIRTRYAQTILGLSWALLQPLVQIAVFSIIFGKIARISSDGIPYVLFATTGVVAWTYISQSITTSSQSLVQDQHILGKVYIPRVIFPLVPVLASLLDFFISLSIVAVSLVYFKIPLSVNLLVLPAIVLFMMVFSLSLGLWFSAVAIRFRDVTHGMPFAIRTLMYTAPVVYPISKIPPDYRFVSSLNPITSIIESMRSCLLGTDFTWAHILPGFFVTFVLLIGGIIYFKHMEPVFVDVI
jgi:homopolymeric O-antigen transport system permease protein